MAVISLYIRNPIDSSRKGRSQLVENCVAKTQVAALDTAASVVKISELCERIRKTSIYTCLRKKNAVVKARLRKHLPNELPERLYWRKHQKNEHMSEIPISDVKFCC